MEPKDIKRDVALWNRERGSPLVWRRPQENAKALLMKTGRFTRFFIYAGTALLIGLSVSQAVIALEILGPRVQVDKTLLDQRIASSREIKQALSTPLPPVEPLPPITAQLANSRAVQMASSPSSKNPWSKTNSLPPEALNAMAKSLTTEAPEFTSSSEYRGESRSSNASDGSYAGSPGRAAPASYGRARTFDRAAGNSGF